MVKCQYYLSDVAYRRVSDADFDAVMKSVDFKVTPRDVITVRDMERFHLNKVNNGVEEGRLC